MFELHVIDEGYSHFAGFVEEEDQAIEAINHMCNFANAHMKEGIYAFVDRYVVKEEDAGDRGGRMFLITDHNYGTWMVFNIRPHRPNYSGQEDLLRNIFRAGGFNNLKFTRAVVKNLL